ncbi:DUF4400 domain-containing protein [Photobacterium leiognathi]|uniref:DUF4400 domain-containing protein n=1 Tax=Photobacterium leiognathi TaxID=553611 RepID=UPI0027395865|nr:DUF4400 domain-containing protein [Photobacterium leiognathi]
MSPQHKSQPTTPTPKTAWYWWPFLCIEYLFYSWCILLLAEWFGHYWGWTVGEHAKATFFSQLALLQDDFPQLTQQIIDHVLIMFEWAAVLASIEFVGVFSAITPYWQGMVFVTLALIARIIMLISFYPLFLLALFMGLFDGLVVRQRRIAQLDREHVTVHYHSKRGLPWIVGGAGIVWLILPGLWPMHPLVVLLPCAMMSGVMMRIVIASYKKYL